MKFTLIGKIKFFSCFCHECPDPTFDRFSILRFGGGGVEKALLGKFYGGQLLEEPALCTKRTRPPVLYLREQQPFCIQESTIILRATFVSSSQGALLKAGWNIYSRAARVFRLIFVSYSSHICLIFVTYLSYIRLIFVLHSSPCREHLNAG